MSSKNNSSPTFSTKISLSLKEKLRKDLEEQGFSFSTPPYSIFSAKKQGVSCTLYESGALVIQGKDKDPFIEFYVEPELLKNLSHTHPELYVNLSPHIGVDESGKGDFFGPLCVASCFANEEQIRHFLKIGVKDSKKISDETILKLSKQIKTSCPHSILRLFPQKYNELYKKFKNLNFLLGWGHATVIEDLFKKTSCKEVLIDQFADPFVVENALKRKNLSLHLEQRTKGESDPVVAAASILARAAFLEGLKSLEEEFSCSLPKGASAITIATGKRLVQTFGEQILEKVSKTHFSSYQEIVLS